MKPRIYLDASVIGYLVNRPSNNLATLNRQVLTRTWWEAAQSEADLLVSDMVIDECERGNPEAAKRRSEVCLALPKLALSSEITELSKALIRVKAVPATEPEDALHIALATIHKVDYLAIWNFSHLVSSQAKRRLHLALQDMGFAVPYFATPEELLEDR